MSKNFELLRQAQREQELLKPSPPLAVSRSRNFEVLRLAKKGSNLFEAAAASTGVASDAVPSPPTGFSPGEAFKLVRRLFLATDALSPRVVVFCAVGHGGEHNSISARVAELLASHSEASVCIVDAKLTSPCLHTYFEVENHRGLTEAILEAGCVQDFTVPTGRSRLSVMLAGVLPPAVDSNTLLVSKCLQARMNELRASFDYVIVDAPPMTKDSVTPFLAGLSDGAILLVEPGFTPRELARSAKEEIEAARGQVLGAVFYRRDLKFLD